MMRGVRTIGIIAVMGVVSLAAAGDQKLGKGVTITEVTPLESLFATPEKFVGKTVRLDGVATAVCEEMGCWMAIGATDKAEQTVRLKASHHGDVLFPISAKGKPVSAQGVFEKVSETDKESKNTIAEQAAVMKVTEFSKKYQINVTGAVIK